MIVFEFVFHPGNQDEAFILQSFNRIGIIVKCYN